MLKLARTGRACAGLCGGAGPGAAGGSCCCRCAVHGVGGQPDRAARPARRERAPRRAPSRLRLGLSGGGPVPPDLKHAWRDRLGLPLCESYGQSELGGFVGLWAPDDPVTDGTRVVVRPAAAGQGGPRPRRRRRGGSARRHRRDLPAWRVHGADTGTGRRRRTRRSADGWLHTGDVGVMDAEGYVFMRGRLSERLLVDGEHWYPRDVEEVLLSHDAVRDAALIGVPDGQGGHRPLAFVTLHPGTDVDGRCARGPSSATAAAPAPPGLRAGGHRRDADDADGQDQQGRAPRRGRQAMTESATAADAAPTSKPRMSATPARLVSRFVHFVLPPLAVAAAVVGVWLFVTYQLLREDQRAFLPPPQRGRVARLPRLGPSATDPRGPGPHRRRSP